MWGDIEPDMQSESILTSACLTDNQKPSQTKQKNYNNVQICYNLITTIFECLQRCGHRLFQSSPDQISGTTALWALIPNTKILESLQTNFTESRNPTQPNPMLEGLRDRRKKRCVHINECSGATFNNGQISVVWT